jgi:aminopeptidase
VYQPSAALLDRYASVLIDYALNGGKGIKKSDVVYLVSQQPGLPLARAVYKRVLERGGFPILSIVDDDFKLLQLRRGSDAQIGFFPLGQYWRQIKRACFLDEPDPVARWRQVQSQTKAVLRSLNALPIERLHVTAAGTDLWISMGEKRQWLGGSGRNIPSFEIFTSPDWRGTEGVISFDLPLYRYGTMIRDIRLEFRDGRVVNATASKNQKMMREMVAQKNADKIGEFSLTDTRFSRITRIMAETLYDENFGGRYGNTHLALGRAYHSAYAGEAKKVSEKQFAQLGFNDSPEHTDIIAGTNRTVEAVMRDGSTRVIYANGRFTL